MTMEKENIRNMISTERYIVSYRRIYGKLTGNQTEQPSSWHRGENTDLYAIGLNMLLLSPEDTNFWHNVRRLVRNNRYSMKKKSGQMIGTMQSKR